MKLVGVESSTSDTTAYNWQSQSTVTASSSSESVKCAVPETDKERKEIETVQWNMDPKVVYNSDIQTKRFITGMGYFLWILPGYLAKVHYDALKEAALREAKKIEESRQPSSD